MGAYALIIQMLVRRYFQADLKPSAYISAAVRIFTVLIVVVVLHQVWTASQVADGTESAVAFVVGFFPLVGIQALQKVAPLGLRVVVPSLRMDYPLSDLDGLNVWYEARLLEEGIEDIRTSSRRTWSTSSSTPGCPSAGWWTGSIRPTSSCTSSRPRGASEGTSPSPAGPCCAASASGPPPT